MQKLNYEQSVALDKAGCTTIEWNKTARTMRFDIWVFNEAHFKKVVKDLTEAGVTHCLSTLILPTEEVPLITVVAQENELFI